MKIVQALEESNILLKGISKTIKNETKEQKGRFLGMLLGTLGDSLLGNMLTGKGMLRAGYGNKEGKGILKAGYESKGSSIKDVWFLKKWFHPCFNKILSENIIGTNLDSMEFLLEIIWMEPT